MDPHGSGPHACGIKQPTKRTGTITRQLLSLLSGAIATTMIVFGSSSGVSSSISSQPGFFRTLSALSPPQFVTPLVVAGVCLLVFAWLMEAPRNNSAAIDARWMLVAWSIPLLLVPPILSLDAAYYADLGYILHIGEDPYVVGLAAAGGPYAPVIADHWIGHGLAYPPLALRASQWIVEATQLHPYWGVVAQRVLALMGVVMIVTLLPRVARYVGVSSRWAYWMGVLNPVVILHFVGGAHNDALMTGLVVLSLWIATTAFGQRILGFVLSASVIGVAMAVKPQAGLAVVAVAGLPIMAELRAAKYRDKLARLVVRCLIAALVALASFAIVSLATGLGFGWVSWLSELDRLVSIAPSFMLGRTADIILDSFGLDANWTYAAAWRLVLIAGIAGLGYLFLRYPDNPMHFVAWGSLIVACMGQSMHPWYLGLGLVLLGATHVAPRTARMLTALVISYALIAYTYAATRAVI